MKNIVRLSRLITGISGLTLVGCNDTTRTGAAPTAVNDPSATTTPVAAETAGTKAGRTGEAVVDAARGVADGVRTSSREAAASMREAGRDLSAKLTEWRLSPADIEADVAANRPIVRTRAASSATPAVKFDEDTVEKAIQGRLAADPALANLKLDVDANKRGEIEIEGKARTTAQIAQAMGVALSQEGVTKVTAKMKLDPTAGANTR